jgi:hypothetical protein
VGIVLTIAYMIN